MLVASTSVFGFNCTTLAAVTWRTPPSPPRAWPTCVASLSSADGQAGRESVDIRVRAFIPALRRRDASRKILGLKSAPKLFRVC